MNYEAITTCDVANGEGLGVVLWVSGCDLHCDKCQNQETWDPNSGKKFTKEQEEEIIRELKRPEIIRFTLSGGHPLMSCNRDTVKNLIINIRKEFGDSISIWLYTGYTYEKLDKECEEIVKLCDVIVDGAFIQEKRDISLPFRGSSNQRLIRIKK